LRDDIFEQYTALKDQLKLKHSFIDSLYTGELEKINLIKTGAFQEAEDVFIDDGETLIKIYSADFKIASLTDSICRIRGIDKVQFLELLKIESHTIIKEITAIEDNISIKLNKLLEEKERLISNLGREMDEVKKTINNLSDISRIKKNI
jgi:hypothetical protein